MRDSRRPAAWLIALGVLAAAGLIAMCVQRTAAAYYVARAPDKAVAWDGADPYARSNRASKGFFAARTPADHARIAGDARAALRGAPLDIQALRVLAFEAEVGGDRPRTVRIMKIAGARAWRDPLTQVWLFSDARRRHDPLAASLHADAALRTAPDLGANLFPAMIEDLRDPAAIAPYVARLAEAPDWRNGFMRALAQGDDAALARTVSRALDAGRAPPTDAENANLVARLVADGDYPGAREEWLRRARFPRGQGPGLIYDGNFQAPHGAPPFNWRLTNQDGAVAESSPAPDGSAALNVQAPSVRTTLLAEQLIILPPGAYRLSGQVLIDPGPPGALFSWRVTCLADGDPDAGEVQLSAGPSGWGKFGADVVIPARNCPAQWLRLSGLAHDGFASANAWFRGMSLTPLSRLSQNVAGAKY